MLGVRRQVGPFASALGFLLIEERTIESEKWVRVPMV